MFCWQETSHSESRRMYCHISLPFFCFWPVLFSLLVFIRVFLLCLGYFKCKLASIHTHASFLQYRGLVDAFSYYYCILQKMNVDESLNTMRTMLQYILHLSSPMMLFYEKGPGMLLYRLQSSIRVQYFSHAWWIWLNIERPILCWVLSTSCLNSNVMNPFMGHPSFPYEIWKVYSILQTF